MQHKVDLFQRRCHDRDKVVGNGLQDGLSGCILREVVTAFRAEREQSMVLVYLIRVLGNLGPAPSTLCQKNLKIEVSV